MSCINERSDWTAFSSLSQLMQTPVQYREQRDLKKSMKKIIIHLGGYST